MRKHEEGYVLISVILGVSLVLLTLLVASTFTQLGSRLITLQLNYQGQALNAAQAGVTEGLDWFRRQTTQPVTSFTPTLNLSASPPVNDTDVITTTPSIQRDYLISSQGNVWAHYEVDTGCTAIPPATCAPSTGQTTAGGSGVLDLSKNRLGPSSGLGVIWQLESTGVVYVRNTSNMAVLYNQSPNQVLASKTVRSEISKIAVNLPADAAMSIPSCSSTSIGTTANQVRVVGGQSGMGVGCASGSGSPSVGAGATLSGGSPGPWGTTGSSFSVTSVFGVTSLSALSNLADISVNSESLLPNPLPPMQLIVVNKGAGNTVTFGSTNPLNGSGILVIIGNLVINSDPNPSNFNGVIYVSGTYTQHQPSTINGSVIVAGSSASIQGNGSFAEMYWDPFMMSQVNQQLRQYRFSRSGYIPCPSWDTNCNSRFAGS